MSWLDEFLDRPHYNQPTPIKISRPQIPFSGGKGYGTTNMADYQESVYVDAASPGGNGTRQKPCATLAQARAICVALGINKVMLIGAWALDADMAGYIFEGASIDAALDLAAFSADDSTFVNLIGPYGIAHAATVDTLRAVNCRGVGPITNPVDLIMESSALAAVTIHINAALTSFNSSAQGTIIDFDVAAAACEVGLYGFSGTIEVENMAQATHFLYLSGNCVLGVNVNCTAGEIVNLGSAGVLGPGGGVTITETYSAVSSLITTLAKLARVRCTHAPQWGALTEEIQLTDGATDTALPQIVVSKIPTGATPTCVKLGVKIGAVENTGAGVNKFNGAQYIQINKDAGGWNNALLIPDDFMAIGAATREGGDVLMGTIDISAIVTGNGTYTIQIHDALVDLDFMLWNNVQTFLLIEYSI